MSRLSQSAAHSVTQLLGTVTVSADALSTAVRSVGNAFDVLNVKSTDWLEDTKIKSAALKEERESAIVDEITFAIATRHVERAKILESNKLLSQAYDQVLAKVQARVDAAVGRQPATQANP